MADLTYNLYRDGEKIASELGEKTYTDTGLEPNTTYKYQVSAENEFGESELSAEVNVTTSKSPVSSIELDEDEVVLTPDETVNLTATINPETAEQSVEWDSDNTDVATVEDGLVTAVGEGEAVITVSSTANPEQSATCTVTVADDGDAPEDVEGLRSTDTTDESTTLNWD